MAYRVLTAAAFGLLLAAGAAAAATPDETAAYEQAIENGSPAALRGFLEAWPGSEYEGAVLAAFQEVCALEGNQGSDDCLFDIQPAAGPVTTTRPTLGPPGTHDNGSPS